MTDTIASGEPLLGPNGLYAILGYLLVLILLGVAGRFASRENSLADFFLAGRGLGFAVLLFTLFATQYSGNTLIGLSANAYRSGFGFLVGSPLAPEHVPRRPLGVHAGLVGLLANLAVILLSESVLRKRARTFAG